MEVTLVSHASIVIDCGSVAIWTDPWLLSKVFNDSWAMAPRPTSDRTFLDRVTHIWLSHEHPDHFNIPTLKSLPAAFRERVTVCYQRRNTHKIFDALRRMGFQRFLDLPNRTRVAVDDVTLYCYQTHLGDSALAVRQGDAVVLNVNDAELEQTDCKIVVREIGVPRVVFNQFSIAGYHGDREYERHLPHIAYSKLARLVDNHRWLHADLTVPFASFVTFCVEDNAYLNQYATLPRAAAAHMAREGCNAYFMRFGEQLRVGSRVFPDADRNVDDYEREMRAAQADVSPCPRIELARIRDAYETFYKRLVASVPWAIRAWMGDLTVCVPDLDVSIRFGARDWRFDVSSGRAVEDSLDVVVNSQPLWFGLAFPFGFETLGVSGRYRVHRFRHWQAWKRVSILLNLEVGLRPRQLLASANRRFLRERAASGLLRQIATRQLRKRQATRSSARFAL